MKSAPCFLEQGSLGGEAACNKEEPTERTEDTEFLVSSFFGSGGMTVVAVMIYRMAFCLPG